MHFARFISAARYSFNIRKISYINFVTILVLAFSFFIYPPARALVDIQDPALSHGGIPKASWRLYRNLTPRYAAWARNRVAQGRAENLSINNISGTEWPLFGSVFYLWGIENLQAAWDAGDHSSGVEPKVFARDAIVAASELVVDPRHAGWVRKHWGDDYLHRENVFYRMLVIAALTSREELLHDHAHPGMLADQVETFAGELDASKSGLLNDYPGECYPGDVMAAVMCIQHADVVLGTDHSVFIRHALRGFIGSKATRLQLPPYSANAETGFPLDDSRGCGNSYFCLTSPGLWPIQARQWYELYDKFFWQESLGVTGYREFANNGPKINWTMDVDAGPVIEGLGVSASAFGVGAARKNGRFDRAYPLATEMIATIWVLPNGVLAAPRMLSNLSDAPMLGEAAILWQLTIQPEKGFPVKTGGGVPASVYVVLIGALLFGVFLIFEAGERFKISRRDLQPVFPAPRLQIFLWMVFMLGCVAFWTISTWTSMILLLAAILLPIKRKMPAGGGDAGGKTATTKE